MTGVDDDELDPRDGSLEAMLFREFVREQIGAGGAQELIRSAADAIARGRRGITVVDELDLGTCAVDEDMFSFRRDGWGTRAVPLLQAKEIIKQELDTEGAG